MSEETRKVEIVLHFARNGFIRYCDIYLARGPTNRSSLRNAPSDQKLDASINGPLMAHYLLALLQRLGRFVRTNSYGLYTHGDLYEVPEPLAVALERLIRLRNTARTKADWEEFGDYAGRLLKCHRLEEVEALVAEVVVSG